MLGMVTEFCLHCKNNWVTLTTFLGCVSCISNQELLPIGILESSLRSFFFVTLASLFFFEDLFGYISGISSHSQATKELCRSRCKRSKKQQTSPEMLVYRLSERRY